METKQFKAESKRLLDLMINSIYTHREIFLRELISNASDAIDKIYYKALVDDSISFNKDNYFIKISLDKASRTIKISDTGIGMTKEELDDNLGVIAKSGSLKFKKENEIKDFAQYIYTKVCFVFVTLAENMDLNRFFVRMNNRGKQLEKHEILKARILHKIDKSERDQYAKIWDLCSDMDKYIFQSNDSETYQVKSIIDFPTFLLHCYKLFTKDDISITKDKLLDIMWEKDTLLKVKSENCITFIESMLRYRVLFDSFVIKFTAKADKDINDKESSYKIKRLGSDGNLVNSNLNDLEMIQNYLRVARSGTNQNYEHWLTDFLEFLDDDNSQFDEIKEIKNFLSNKDKNKLPESLVKKESQKDEPLTKLQEKLVEHLEKVDTKQICKVNIKDKELEDISREFLKEYLSNGTNTPHYWFYRLEYYLWKWGKDKPEKLGSFCKKLDDYSFDLKAKNCVLNSNYFHFRMLGSIEHFSAVQRQDKREKKWNLDIFGNLALISQNFNSSLSNELENCKKDKVIEQLKRGRLESLKYFIMCANLNQVEWTEGDAQEHQNQMIAILIKSLRFTKFKQTKGWRAVKFHSQNTKI